MIVLCRNWSQSAGGLDEWKEGDNGEVDLLAYTKITDIYRTLFTLKSNAMKKLFSLFKVAKEQPRCLSSFLKIEFKEELVNIDMPHVGGYKPGSRTKVER